MKDYAPESFGITRDAKHMAWQFVGQVGHYGDAVPDDMREPVLRAILLAYFRMELVEGGDVATMAAALSASALLDAYERLTGRPVPRDWQDTKLHNNTADIPRADLLDLAAKAMLSASMRPDDVTNGEAYSVDRRLRWDIAEHDGQPALLLSAPMD